MLKATKIEDLVGDLDLKERALELKYRMELHSMREDTTIDWDGKELCWQYYKTIEEDDWHDGYLYALGRTIMNLRRGVPCYFCGGDKSMIAGDIGGMIGEICSAKLFGVEWSRDIILKNAKKYDIIAKGETVDIKTSLRRNSFSDNVVIADSKKLGDSSYYHFARFLNDGKKMVINLKGWLPEDKVILDSNRRENKTGYWVDVSKLHKFNNTGK